MSLQIIRDISPLVLGRALKLCNFLDYQDIKVRGSVILCLPGRELYVLQPSRCVATKSDTTQYVPAQVVYKRYASLYFVVGIDPSDNELITLEIIHHYVEVLDRYFGNVCELDLIFNFHKVSQVSRDCSCWPNATTDIMADWQCDLDFVGLFYARRNAVGWRIAGAQ